jgi:hypothetical protein
MVQPIDGKNRCTGTRQRKCHGDDECRVGYTPAIVFAAHVAAPLFFGLLYKVFVVITRGSAPACVNFPNPPLTQHRKYSKIEASKNEARGRTTAWE